MRQNVRGQMSPPPLEVRRCFIVVAVLVACGASACSTRFALSHADSRSVTANRFADYEQRGEETPKLIRVAEDRRLTPEVSFILLAADAEGPTSAAFRSAMAQVDQLGTSSQPVARARVLRQSQGELRKVADDSGTDHDLRVAAQANLAAVALALGDTDGFREAQAQLKGANVPDFNDTKEDDLFLLFKVIKAIRPIPNAPFPEAGKRTGEASRTESEVTGYRVDIERRPEFAWDATTPQSVHFPSIDIRCEYSGEQRTLAKIGFTLRNNTPRVVELKKMAVRIVHNGAMFEFKTVDAGSRVLPGNSGTVWLQPDEGQVNFNYVLGSESRDNSEFTVFDVPVVFDDLGRVTKMDNVTWKFKFKPGLPGGRVAQTKSLAIVVWQEFQRGIDLLTDTEKR